MDFSQWDEHLFGSPKLTDTPKVSICIITYNHEQYFEKCIENVLSQNINFEIEIIIGEDCSTDSTAKSVEKYALLYPEKIKAHIRPVNIGAKTNFLHCFFQCRGEFIVFIEADDYFTDKQKLQTQVDYLDANPNVSACFHNAQIIYEDDSNREPEFINLDSQKVLTETKDFFVEKETWFMATASVMMRRKYVEKLPDWFLNCKSGDIPLYVILAEKGPIAYINKVMSVYRKNINGQSYTDNVQSLDFIKNRIYMYSKLNDYTHLKYDYLLKPILAEYHLMAISCREIQPNFSKKIIYLLKAYLLAPPRNRKVLYSDIKTYILSPQIVNKYLNFRSKLNKYLGIHKT